VSGNYPPSGSGSSYVSGGYVYNGYVRDMNDRSHYCLILPVISDIKINGTAAALQLKDSSAARLDFLARVDRDQLPLTSYSIDWGDGVQGITSVAGVKLRDRANVQNPFSLYHLFSLTKIRSAAAADSCSALDSNPANPCYYHYCDATGSCFVRLKITVTDNWRASSVATFPPAPASIQIRPN